MIVVNTSAIKRQCSRPQSMRRTMRILSHRCLTSSSSRQMTRVRRPCTLHRFSRQSQSPRRHRCLSRFSLLNHRSQVVQPLLSSTPSIASRKAMITLPLALMLKLLSGQCRMNRRQSHCHQQPQRQHQKSRDRFRQCHRCQTFQPCRRCRRLHLRRQSSARVLSLNHHSSYPRSHRLIQASSVSPANKKSPRFRGVFLRSGPRND